MNIILDGRPLLDKEPTGVTFFTINFIKNLSQARPDFNFFIFTTGRKKPSITWFENLPNVHLCHYQIPNKLFNFLQLFFHYPKIENILKKNYPEKNFDVLVLPNLNFFSTRLPYFAIFHDLSFEFLPNFYSLKSRLWHFLLNPKKTAQKAFKIFAVSENTKNDLQNLYKIDQTKISVNFPNLKDFFKPEKNLPKEKNILFVGTIEKRKNILNLVKVFNDFSVSFPEHRLILIGKPGFGFVEIFNAIKNNEKIIYKNYLPENELTEYFQTAEFFVFPSFYEGFGLPIVEAMSYGLPIIASANSSMPEVISDAGILFNVFNNNQLLEAMKTLASNQNIRQYFATKSLTRYTEIQSSINRQNTELLENLQKINDEVKLSSE